MSRLVLYSFINTSFISSSLTFFPVSLLYLHLPHCTATVPQSLQQLHSCCMIPVLNTGPVNRCYSTPKTSRPALRPPTFLFNRFQGSFLPLNSQDTKLTAHLYLVSKLRMSRVVPLLHLFTFMMWAVITFNSHFHLPSFHSYSRHLSYQQTCPTALLFPFASEQFR